MSLPPGLISRRILFAVVVVAVLAMAGCPDTGRSLYYRDVGQNHLPNRALAAQMVRAGDLPLWNPHRGNGQPFLANPNSLILRPTTPLFLIFPPARAHVPFLIGVMLMAGVASTGSFLLLRECGRSDPAAAVGALAFAMSGAFLSLGQLVNLLEGAAWIPATLWLAQRSLTRGWRPWAPLAGVAAALVITSGEPVLAAILALSLLALPSLRAAGAGARLRLLLVGGGLALLVASAQLLPLLDLAVMSARGEELAAGESLKWSLPPAALLEAVMPGLWGDPARASAEAYWGSGLFETSLPFFPSIHIGLPVLLLAAAGLAAPGTGRWGSAAAGLAGLLLALGRHTPAHALLAGWMPVISQSRYPVKWFLLVAWCAAFLAARGFDALAGDRIAGQPARLSRAVAAAGWGVAGGALAAGAALFLGGGAAAPAMRRLLSIPPAIGDGILGAHAAAAVGSGLMLAGAATALLLLAALSTRLRAPIRPLVMAVAALLPSAFAALPANPKAPPGLLFERSPLLAAVPEGAWTERRLYGFPRPPGFAYRVPDPAAAREAGLTADSLAWGMRWDTRTLRFVAPALEGVRGAYDQGAESLLGLGEGAAVARRLREGAPLEETLRWLRAASVGWVVAYGEIADPRLRRVADLPGESNILVGLYALEGSAPRASLVRRAMVAESARHAASAIGAGEADPSVTVLLELPPGGRLPPVEAEATGGSLGSGPTDLAEIVEDRASRVRVRTRSDGDRWLVLTDTWDPGWSASIDGEPAEILRANGMFRAVRVPSGEQVVEFAYRPGSVLRGAAGTLLGLAAAAALIVAGRRRARIAEAP